MTDYTLDQVTTMLNALTLRVNALDGQNLPTGITSSNSQIIGQLNSIQTDLNQLAASFENQLSIINTALATIQSQINVLSGAPNTQS
jgi:hypothetical protein